MDNIATHLNDDSTYSFIQNLALGYQKSQILFTAIKYDVFSLIQQGFVTAEDMASKLDVNKDALTRLLDAVVAISLLSKNGFNYHNTETSEKHLITGGKEFLYNSDIWNSWGSLYDTIKTGNATANTAIHDKEPSFIEDFIIAEDWSHKFEIQFVLPDIKLQNTKRLLKIGAISYRYPLEIAKLHPEIEVHILDSSAIVAIAEKMIRKEYDCKNIKFIATDYKTTQIDGNYDVVFIDSILEGNSIINNIERLKIIYNLIKNGGKLVIHQCLINDCRTKPLKPVLKSITLLLNTKSGAAYTYSDLWVVLREANFQTISFETTEINTHIITATKSILG